MKRYEVRVVVNEGRDEFWEELTNGNSTGADEMQQMVSNALEVTLVKYENK